MIKTTKIEKNIVVDMGYDSLKVSLEGNIFKIPFYCVELERTNLNNNLSLGSYIYKNELSTNRWVVGECAKQYVCMSSQKKFIDNTLKIKIETAIAIALNNNPFFANNLSNIDFVINIILPNLLMKKDKADIIRQLQGIHNFQLKIENNLFKKFEFNVKSINIEPYKINIITT